MKADTGTPVPYRVGEWLPSDQVSLVRWLEAIIQKTHAEQKALHPVIADFQDLIENDPEIYMLFNQMFEQVPRKPPYNKDPTGKPQVRDYRHMLQLFRPGVTLEFDHHGQTPGLNSKNIHINSRIATVVGK